MRRENRKKIFIKRVARMCREDIIIYFVRAGWCGQFERLEGAQECTDGNMIVGVEGIWVI